MLISLFSLAAAGPLADVARIELENARELHRVVQTADLSTRYKVTEACTAAHSSAAESIQKARADYDAQKYQAAYDSLHATLMQLKPCALELAAGPKPYEVRIKTMLRSSDEQLTALAAHLEEKGNDTSKAAYGEAVGAKTTARAKGLDGQTKAAVEDWYTMLEHIAKAVSATT